PDRVFERQNSAAVDVFGKYAGIRAVRSGMRHPRTEHTYASIARHSRVRITQDPFDIGVAHGVINHLSPAVQNQIEDRLDFTANVLRTSFHDVYLGDGLSLIGPVA